MSGPEQGGRRASTWSGPGRARSVSMCSSDNASTTGTVSGSTAGGGNTSQAPSGGLHAPYRNNKLSISKTFRRSKASASSLMTARERQSMQAERLAAKAAQDVELLDEIRKFCKAKINLDREYARGLKELAESTAKRTKTARGAGIEETWQMMIEQTETMSTSLVDKSTKIEAEFMDKWKEEIRPVFQRNAKRCEELGEKFLLEHNKSHDVLTKERKRYEDLERFAQMATSHREKSEMRKRKGSMFRSARATEESITKAKNKEILCVQRSNRQRNTYILALADINTELTRYNTVTRTALMDYYDGDYYSQLKKFFVLMAEADREWMSQNLAMATTAEEKAATINKNEERWAFLRSETNANVFGTSEEYKMRPHGTDTTSAIILNEHTKQNLNTEMQRIKDDNEKQYARELKAVEKQVAILKMTNVTNFAITDERENINKRRVEQREAQRVARLIQEKNEARTKLLATAGVIRLDELREPVVMPTMEELQATITSSPINCSTPDTDDDFAEDTESYLDTVSQCSHATANGDADNQGDTHGLVPNQQYSVMYEYQANTDDELTINEDEVITILSVDNDGWARGTNAKGETGLIPAAYLYNDTVGGVSDPAPAAAAEAEHASPEHASPEHANPEHDGAGGDGGEASPEAGQAQEQAAVEDSSDTNVPLQPRPRSSVSGSAISDDVNPPVAPQRPASVHDEGAGTATTTADTINPTIIGTVVTIFRYEAEEDDELAFDDGVTIDVISRSVDGDDDYWEGIYDGKRGVFSSLMVEQDTWQPC